MQSICVYDTYDVPFLSIITAFLIKLNASFLLINTKFLEFLSILDDIYFVDHH